ncbi:hypothetical protein OEV98_13425 [Caldibacillus lycopersici]|uniref:Uncharacterized protein n=1 Tax=Perspicuibacillus lycopersici TaxID=1325689 RepID=A0AAE3IW85_9BACI|nr:hypothetical protein [Perspicuibacillus lycopersici]MCU9614539.1 hypothetical protein [Perspicuibacillus lycopersici]
MSRNHNRNRTRALLVVDDLFVQAENIVIVGDRANGQVAGAEDNRNNGNNGNVQDIIDDILDEICGRR